MLTRGILAQANRSMLGPSASGDQLSPEMLDSRQSSDVISQEYLPLLSSHKSLVQHTDSNTPDPSGLRVLPQESSPQAVLPRVLGFP